MPDWPPQPLTVPTGGAIHAGSEPSLAQEACAAVGSFAGTAAWPSANRALYVPFMVEQTVVAYKMAFEVGVQAGNCDVGIYDVLGHRLVSAGSTVVGPAGLQTIDITDTTLGPGIYYMAMNCDTTVTLTLGRVAAVALALQTIGFQQQAVGAVTLPDPATFANPTSAYLPSLCVALRPVI